MKKSLNPLLMLAVAGGLLTGCMTERPVMVAPQVATADTVYVNQPTQPPPADQQDVVPPAPGQLGQWWFIPGNWVWRGQWVWTAGHWRPRPHSGDVWLVGKWVQKDNVYVWQRGRWRSGAHYDEESNENH